MSVTKEDIIRVARTYLGTPYANQGRSKEMLDCGGLLLMVGRELGITELEYLGYSNSPDGETFERLLNQELTEIPKEETDIGDIIACDYSSKGEHLGIQHTAIVTELEPRLKVIHAKRPRTNLPNRDRGVIEHYLHGYDERGWVKTYRIPNLKITKDS